MIAGTLCRALQQALIRYSLLLSALQNGVKGPSSDVKQTKCV